MDVEQGKYSHHPGTHPAVIAATAEKDPVCGMAVARGAAKGGSAAYAGHEYWFCSAKCRAKFVADPQMYVAPSTPVAAPQLDEFLMPSEPHLRIAEMAALGWAEAAVYGDHYGQFPAPPP